MTILTSLLGDIYESRVVDTVGQYQRVVELLLTLAEGVTT